MREIKMQRKDGDRSGTGDIDYDDDGNDDVQRVSYAQQRTRNGVRTVREQHNAKAD